jgi:NDP-sugar pyrophosphorylase family protein
MKDGVLCLFAIDDNQKMVGTLTDGDIRRALIAGISINDTIESAIKKDFDYLRLDEISQKKIKEYRLKNIKLLPILNNEGVIVKVYNLALTKSILPIDVVLMAGGKGLRLRPLTENIPKPLLKVGDKSIIDYTINNLVNYGIENINVNINYLAEKIENHFKINKFGVNIICNKEPEFLGTMGSIKYVKNLNHDMVLVMNSDLFTNIDFEDFYLNHLEQSADMSVASVPYSVPVPYGIFDIKESKINGIVEKPTYNYYANGGIYLIKKHLFDLIPDNTFFNATDFINLLINKSYKVVSFPIIGYWIDIGNPDDYKKVQDFVSHMKLES